MDVGAIRGSTSLAWFLLVTATLGCGGGGGDSKSPLDSPTELSGDWVLTQTVTASSNNTPPGTVATTILSIEQHGAILSVERFSTCHAPMEVLHGSVSGDDFTLAYTDDIPSWLQNCDVHTEAEFALTLAVADGPAVGTGKVIQTLTGLGCGYGTGWFNEYSLTMTRCDASLDCPWVPCS